MSDDRECPLDHAEPWKKVECVDDRNTSSRMVWVFGLLAALIAAGVLVWDALNSGTNTARNRPAASTTGAGSGPPAAPGVPAPPQPPAPSR